MLFTPSLRSQPVLGHYASPQVRKNVQTETVLYRFAGGTDGSNPAPTLLNVGGTLYGTTFAGGGKGLGTVYSITPSGTKTMLYSFAGGTDGANPNAGLVNVGGTGCTARPLGAARATTARSTRLQLPAQKQCSTGSKVLTMA